MDLITLTKKFRAIKIIKRIFEMSTLSSGERQFELRDRLTLLYQNLYYTSAVTFIAASVLTFSFDSQGNSDDKLVWLLVMIILMLFRMSDCFYWLRQSNKGFKGSSRTLNRFRIGALCSAVLWSFYCIYFQPESDIYELSVTLIVVASMAGGAATVLSADRFLVLFFTQILLIPYSFMLLATGSPEHQTLGVLALIFSLLMLSMAYKASKFTLESIRLRYKHERLLKNMKHEVAARTKEIVELNRFDSLTKLLNRPTFIKEANAYIEKNENDYFSVYFIDLDNFKPANDNFGHDVGDKLLRQLADRLNDKISKHSLLCRWGGDEFIILAKTLNKKDIDTTTMIIKQAITDPFFISSYRIEMDASIGVSIYPTHSRTLSELITYADISMYDNKNTKKQNHVIFSDHLAMQVQNDFFLSDAIRKAVQNKQLHLVFQPIVKAQDQTCYAVEALLRWELDGTLISPDIFIPIAEKNGAIVEIGYWVLEEAIALQRNISLDGYDTKMTINVSVVQFEDPLLVDNIANLLVKHHVDPRNINIEITESVFSTNKAKLLSDLVRLQELGLKISIDDFGTGYSSLSAIQDFRVNVVKIDRSFINNLDSNGGSIIKAVMIMAKELDYQVVAEGVETEKQLLILKELGVPYLQGYLFSKPETYTKLLTKLKNGF